MLCPISPADLGRRLTVRAARPDGSSFDTVGPLTGFTPGRITVEGRRGPVDLGWPPDPDSALPAAVAARVVRPGICAVDLQRIAQAGWPPTESHSASGWDLRWSSGATARGNSVRVARDPGRDLPALLAEVTAWYRARGQSPLLQVPRPWLDVPLRSAGWLPGRPVIVMTAPTAGLLEDAASPVEITLSDRADATWLAGVDREDDADPDSLRAIMERPSLRVFATAWSDTGDAAGIARASLGDGWCGLTNVATGAQWRRRGVARALTSRLARWAHDHRVPSMYLQVLEDNAAAIGLYETLGFTRHHAYDYWRPGQP